MKKIFMLSRKVFMVSILFVLLTVLFTKTINANEEIEDINLYDEISELELIELYEKQEQMQIEDSEKMVRIENELQNYTLMDENGLLSFSLTNDEYESLSNDSKIFIDNIRYSKELLDEERLTIIEVNSVNTLTLAEGVNEFSAQSMGIKFVGIYKDFLFFKNVWVGFDVVPENQLWTFVIAGLGIGISSANMILDILLLDVDVISKIGLIYPITVMNAAAQFISHLSKIPYYVITWLKLMITASIGSITSVLTWVIRGLQLFFPPLIHSLAIINYAATNKTVVLQYRPILYSNYKVV